MTSREKLQKLRAKRTTQPQDMSAMSDAELLAYAQRIAKQYLPESTTAAPKTKPTTTPTKAPDKAPTKSPNPFDPRPGKTPKVNPAPKNLAKKDEDEECCGYEMPGAKKPVAEAPVDEDEEISGGDDELKAAVMQILQKNKGV